MKLPKPPKMKNLTICFSLWRDDNDFLNGAIRNIQLANLYFPHWTTYIFIPTNMSNGKELHIRKNMILKMKSLGAMIVYLDTKLVEDVPINVISLLIADDENVTNFFIKDLRYRLSECDYIAMDKFFHSNKTISLFQSHHHKKNTTFVFPEMLAANRMKLMERLKGKSMKQFIQVHFSTTLLSFLIFRDRAYLLPSNLIMDFRR